MRQQGLRAIQPRSFVPRTTVSDNLRASENLLTSISPNEPKAVLVGDITYLPLLGGTWCNLASWQDKVSKRVAGWSISDRMTEDLVIGALDKAFERGFIAKDAIIHSDRGKWQSPTEDFRLPYQNG